MKKSIIASLILFCLLEVTSYAQKISLSSNVLDLANLGTTNAELSYAVHRHFSATAGFKYNPFYFADANKEFRSRQISYWTGVRWWPWHVYSGWWFGGKLRYQEYNSGGLFSERTSEGDRFGAGISAGYTHMILKHLNLDLGAGVWGGYDKFTTYACPTCGLTLDKGSKAFVLPSDLIVSLCYVF